VDLLNPKSRSNSKSSNKKQKNYRATIPNIYKLGKTKKEKPIPDKRNQT
jgi:hypothetical protein